MSGNPTTDPPGSIGGDPIRHHSLIYLTPQQMAHQIFWPHGIYGFPGFFWGFRAFAGDGRVAALSDLGTCPRARGDDIWGPVTTCVSATKSPVSYWGFWWPKRLCKIGFRGISPGWRWMARVSISHQRPRAWPSDGAGWPLSFHRQPPAPPPGALQSIDPNPCRGNSWEKRKTY